MPRYKLLAKHFINNSIYEEGEIVTYDGTPGAMMELVDEKPAGSRTKGKQVAAASGPDDVADVFGGE